jgi:hypothetical protein
MKMRQIEVFANSAMAGPSGEPKNCGPHINRLRECT